MPARKRAGQRVRAPARSRIVELCFEMEEPLNEVLDAAQALHLMGVGLTQLGGENEGRAIIAVSWNACRRLAALQDTWRRLCKAAVR